ncbi:MAG: Uma2 family endonuclease [Panacagrimonas sp.]
MTAVCKPSLTETEYLAIERASIDRKCEFVNGEMFAMSGASFPHNVLTRNLIVALQTRLRGGPCQALSQDLRTRVNPTRMYTYPDVLIVCGTPQFIDGEHDTLINPTVIFEVLSPSTESWDRGGKFQHYQAIESLSEYVLVSQTAKRVELFRRQAPQWTYIRVEGAGENLSLQSVDLTIPLAEIFDGLNFDGVAEPAPPPRS